MQLTRYTDYAFRTLFYLNHCSERLVTINEIAEAYGISRNHLVKVVHALGRLGFIETFRGKRGGIRLGRAPEAIHLDEVVRHMEDRLEPVNCDTPPCPIREYCRLRDITHEAMDAFLATLAGYTLADITGDTRDPLPWPVVSNGDDDARAS